MCHRPDVPSDRTDLAQDPHQNVQFMCTQITKASYPRDRRIGHPTIFIIEPSAQRTTMTVRAAHARDLPEVAFHDLILEENVFGISPHEISSREQQVGFLNRLRHFPALLAVAPQRLLDTQ